MTGCSQSYEHVLSDREVERQLWMLEGSGQTECSSARRWAAKMGASQSERSAIRSLRTRDQVDESRLAGSVGTDQTKYLSCGEVQIDVGQSDNASVVLPQAPTLEQRFASDGPGPDGTGP